MTEATEGIQPGTLRIERDASRRIHHTEAGRIAIPVLVVTNTPATLPGEMVLPGDVAESMCDEIDAILRGPSPRPDRAAEHGLHPGRSRRATLQDTTFGSGNA